MTVETVTEWCSHCEHEVELENNFKAQTCPNKECGEIILPCAQCVTMDCEKCPFAL